MESYRNIKMDLIEININSISEILSIGIKLINKYRNAKTV